MQISYLFERGYKIVHCLVNIIIIIKTKIFYHIKYIPYKFICIKLFKSLTNFLIDRSLCWGLTKTVQNIGKWSEMSYINTPPCTSFCNMFVYMRSIKVAELSLILVGMLIILQQVTEYNSLR